MHKRLNLSCELSRSKIKAAVYKVVVFSITQTGLAAFRAYRASCRQIAAPTSLLLHICRVVTLTDCKVFRVRKTFSTHSLKKRLKLGLEMP